MACQAVTRRLFLSLTVASHILFVISGRTDAPGVPNIVQENLNHQYQAGNGAFRIPTPVFGAGLIESIPDTRIITNQAKNAAAKAALGISGFPNRSGNDGTITRFGWKAQNKSLLMFSGEAYNVEMGVSNDLFQQKRDDTYRLVSVKDRYAWNTKRVIQSRHEHRPGSRRHRVVLDVHGIP